MCTHFTLGLKAKIAEKVDFEIQKYHIYGFSTKSVPAQHDSPDNTISQKPKISVIRGPPV